MWIRHLGENEAIDMQEGNTGEMHSVRLIQLMHWLTFH